MAERANFISKLFYWWMNPIFEIGSKRRLEEEDMFDITDDERSKGLGDELERAWSKEVETNQYKGTKPSLFWALFRTYRHSYILYGLLLLFEEFISILQPILLSGLIRYFTKDAASISKAESYMYAAGVGLCAVILAFTHHPYYLGVQKIGMRMKIACSSLIYRQSLNLSSEARRRQTSTGQIVDLLSNDVRHFGQLMTMLHFLWIGPLEVIAVFTILFAEIGLPVAAGFLVMFSMIPLIKYFGSWMSKYKKSSAAHRDKRLDTITEIIGAIKAVKLYCWETPFGERLKKERRREVNVQRKILDIHLVQDTLTFVSKFLYIFPVILWMICASIDLRASSVFLALRIYDHVGLIVGRRMYGAYILIKETKVSLGRIQNFLLLEKKRRYNKDESGISVDIKIDSAKWQRDSDKVVLRNISTRVKQGQVLTIAGPVGCGKTSLLMAIMNELPEIDGKVSVGGRLAYASQQPWIFSGTLNENITAYNEERYDEERYDKIIKACSLDKDFEDMPNGDKTLIGDRGIDLSGGQQSRVSLARALYRDADIYLLDDPLSAVDSHTGQRIYERVIQGLLQEKVVILVTHQRQFLRFSDEVIFISKDGTMVERVEKESLPTLSDSKIDELSGLDTENAVRYSESDDGRVLAMVKDSPNDKKEGLESTTVSLQQPTSVQSPEQEERREKTVKWSTYTSYFSASKNVFMIGIVIITFLATQGSYVFSDWWLSNWARQEEAKYIAISNQIDNITEGERNKTLTKIIQEVNTQFNLTVLGFAIIAVIAFALFRAYCFLRVILGASQNLHNRMFNSILATNLNFFERHSVTGQIQNRFSEDVRKLDESLPETFFEFLQCALTVLGIVVVAGLYVPCVYIILIPLICVFVLFRNQYVQTSSQIRRLQSTTSSPVIGHATSSQIGIYTIRAFNVEENMLRLYDRYQDTHTQATTLSLTSARWFAVRLDLLCAAFIITVVFACVKAADSLNAGSVGLSITYTMGLMALFQWCVRQSTEVQNKMVSVERILEYVKLSPESTTSRAPPENWPQTGVISFRNASLQYPRKSQPALRNLFFTIRDQEKVGIVGRTGAGKSSLVTMLFRLVEPDGFITIDGENIKEMKLQTLRKSISVIPQEPVLFTGSFRKNVDPFEEHRDEEIWNALDEVQLKEDLEKLPEGLDTEVAEAGGNFSVGQRQLICLARVILFHRKIVIIDEATANVDNQTDAKIHSVIRRKFKDCTVLTIAHRLQTVMDSDRILFLEDGKAIIDEPYALLQDTECNLLKLVEETGSVTAARLKKMAKDAWDNRHGDHPISDLDENIVDNQSADIIYSGVKTRSTVSEEVEDVDEKTKLLK